MKYVETSELFRHAHRTTTTDIIVHVLIQDPAPRCLVLHTHTLCAYETASTKLIDLNFLFLRTHERYSNAREMNLRAIIIFSRQFDIKLRELRSWHRCAERARRIGLINKTVECRCQGYCRYRGHFWVRVLCVRLAQFPRHVIVNNIRELMQIVGSSTPVPYGAVYRHSASKYSQTK